MYVDAFVHVADVCTCTGSFGSRHRSPNMFGPHPEAYKSQRIASLSQVTLCPELSNACLTAKKCLVVLLRDIKC